MSGLENIYYSEFSTQKVNEIKYLLDTLEAPKTFEALKRLIAFSVKGHDVSAVFPQVVKAIHTQNLDVKKLIYQFIVINSRKDPDICLLTVDALHKDATETANPLVRGLALRTLSSLNTPDIIQVLQMDVSRSTHDTSPYVRKTAAFAIPKLVRLDPSLRENAIEMIENMLKDTSTVVLGPVICAFNAVCPNEWRLIHPQFRKLVLLVVDFDEWSQIIALKMFLNYARCQFPSPFDPSSDADPEEVRKKAELEGIDFESFLNRAEHRAEKKSVQSAGTVDSDLRLLLTNIGPLLQSANAGVVMGVVSILFYCAPEAEFRPAARAVTRLLFSNTSTSDIVLRNVASMAAQRPNLFSPSYREFFVFANYSLPGKLMRLKILSYIANEGNARGIIREFEEYVYSPDKVFVCATIQAIYRVAVAVPSLLNQCTRGVMGLLISSYPEVVAEAVLCIKSLLQHQATDLLTKKQRRKRDKIEKKKEKKNKEDEDKEEEEREKRKKKEEEEEKKRKKEKDIGLALFMNDDNGKKQKDNEELNEEEMANKEKEITKLLLSLSRLLKSITQQTARASVVWLLGTYAHFIPKHSPDCLRELVSTFTTETIEVKLQILTFAAKLLVRSTPNLASAVSAAAGIIDNNLDTNEQVSTQLQTSIYESIEEENKSKKSKSKSDKKKESSQTEFSAVSSEAIARLFVQVANLSRFDSNPDIRDRARFYRTLAPANPLVAQLMGIEQSDENEDDRAEAEAGDETTPDDTPTSKQLRKIVAQTLTSDRPRPSASTEEDLALTSYTLCTIAHVFGASVYGYAPLPSFPERVDPAISALRNPQTADIDINKGRDLYSPRHSISTSTSRSTSTDSRSSRSSSGSTRTRSSSKDTSFWGSVNDKKSEASNSGSSRSRSQSKSLYSRSSRSRSESGSQSREHSSRSDSERSYSRSRSSSRSDDSSYSSSRSESRSESRSPSRKRSTQKTPQVTKKQVSTKNESGDDDDLLRL